MSADLEAARDRLVAAALRTLVADEAGQAAVEANAGGQAHEREIAAEKDFDAAFAGLLAAARSWRDRAALAHLEAPKPHTMTFNEMRAACAEREGPEIPQRRTVHAGDAP